MRKIITWAVVAIVLLAIWRINNGDVNNIADSIWLILNKGADIAISIWNAFTHVTSNTAPTAVPTIAATPGA